jgi:hypothetical protein
MDKVIPAWASDNKVAAWAGGGVAFVLIAIIAFIAGQPATDAEADQIAGVCRPVLEKVFSDQLPTVEDNDHHPVLMVPYKKLDKVDILNDNAFCSLGARAVERPLPDTGSWYWRAVSFATLHKKGGQWKINFTHLCLPGDAADELCQQEDIRAVVCDVDADCPGVTTE